MLIQSTTATFLSMTTLFWGYNAAMESIYMILFCMYFYVRCYNMMTEREKKVGYLGYPITFMGFVLYMFSCRGFIPNVIGTTAFVIVISFVFVHITYILVSIVLMIKRNPMHTTSSKQTRLMKISNYTIVFVYGFGLPLSITAAIGTYLQINGVIDAAIGLTSVVVFGFALSNIAFTVNRHLEDSQIRATGTNAFHSTRKFMDDSKTRATY